MRHLFFFALIASPLLLTASKTDAESRTPNTMTLLTDFSTASADLGWFILNDNVMGGQSSGRFELLDGELRFTGTTNTQGGGFSSIRTQELKLDLSMHRGLRLRVKGDGRRYTWRLVSDARWRGRPVSYWADFDTRADTWLDVDISFTDFVPIFRGSALDGPPLNTESIEGMGLMINDKRDGAFELSLASVLAR